MILQRPIFKDKYFAYAKQSEASTGVITQYFGENLNNFYKQLGMLGHNGIDFGCQDGEQVFASHDGKVIRVYNEENSSITKGYGVYIQSLDDTYFTVYWHFKNTTKKVGDIVKAGDLIGYADNTGQSTGTHLHWGLYLLPRETNNGYDGAVNPLPYLEENQMLKIIGNNQDKKQYLVGKDGKLRWIFNPTLLQDLIDAGVVDGNAEWKDNLDGYEIVSPWAVIK